ncbi:MAG: glycosyltransferase [Actinobacteria bacterium]|nr:glycosyltransferase [Actinomycetota bacterium]
MRVLYFGTYERDYPRNAQVMSALRGAGVEVIERHAPVWEKSRHNWGARTGAGLRLMLAEARLWWPPKDEYDLVMVGYPGHFDMPRARRAAGDRPLVFNPLVSLHDTMVGDRERYSSRSFSGRVLAAVDRKALRLADLVIADTRANGDFLAEVGEIPRSKVEVCFVGAEDRLFHAGWRPDEPFRVLFVGKLIPLHGVETIIAAARLAPEIPFRIVGSGQLQHLLDKRPDNVEWVPWVNYEELPRELWGAGVALGIFGTSDKARRVIPNKAYQALATGVPLVTGDTPAARELLADERDSLLVPPDDPAALAGAIRRVAVDRNLAQQLSEGGRRTYVEQASEEVLGARWRALLEKQL